MNAKIPAVGIMLSCVLIAAPFYMNAQRHLPTSAVKPAPSQSTLEQRLAIFTKDKHLAKVLASIPGAVKVPNLGWVPKGVVLAAIAKNESDFRPLIVGDNGNARGLYQIWPSIHGWKGDTLESQSTHCLNILENIWQTKHFMAGLAAYNGSGEAAARYARRVYATIRKIYSIRV